MLPVFDTAAWAPRWGTAAWESSRTPRRTPALLRMPTASPAETGTELLIEAGLSGLTRRAVICRGPLSTQRSLSANGTARAARAGCRRAPLDESLKQTLPALLALLDVPVDDTPVIPLAIRTPIRGSLPSCRCASTARGTARSRTATAVARATVSGGRGRPGTRTRRPPAPPRRQRPARAGPCRPRRSDERATPARAGANDTSPSARAAPDGPWRYTSFERSDATRCNMPRSGEQLTAHSPQMDPTSLV